MNRLYDNDNDLTSIVRHAASRLASRKEYTS